MLLARRIYQSKRFFARSCPCIPLKNACWSQKRQHPASLVLKHQRTRRELSRHDALFPCVEGGLTSPSESPPKADQLQTSKIRAPGTQHLPSYVLLGRGFLSGVLCTLSGNRFCSTGTVDMGMVVCCCLKSFHASVNNWRPRCATGTRRLGAGIPTRTSDAGMVLIKRTFTSWILSNISSLPLVTTTMLSQCKSHTSLFMCSCTSAVHTS